MHRLNPLPFSAQHAKPGAHDAQCHTFIGSEIHLNYPCLEYVFVMYSFWSIWPVERIEKEAEKHTSNNNQIDQKSCTAYNGFFLMLLLSLLFLPRLLLSLNQISSLKAHGIECQTAKWSGFPEQASSSTDNKMKITTHSQNLECARCHFYWWENMSKQWAIKKIRKTQTKGLLHTSNKKREHNDCTVRVRASKNILLSNRLLCATPTHSEIQFNKFKHYDDDERKRRAWA